MKKVKIDPEGMSNPPEFIILVPTLKERGGGVGLHLSQIGKTIHGLAKKKNTQKNVLYYVQRSDWDRSAYSPNRSSQAYSHPVRLISICQRPLVGAMNVSELFERIAFRVNPPPKIVLRVQL